MACVFFVSDTHFGHEGVCKFLRDDGTKLRPFDNAKEMDEFMIESWNKVVRPQDKIYHLGDVVMRKEDLKVLASLNGHKRLVRGNHDMYATKEYLKYFEDIYGVRVLDNMILSHIPLQNDCITKRYNINIHGHLHANHVKDANGVLDGKYLNICVEHTNYAPISLEDLRLKIQQHQNLYPPVYTYSYQKGAD